MKRRLHAVILLTAGGVGAVLSSSPAGSGRVKSEVVLQAIDGESVFEARCASCHVGAALEEGTPDRDALRAMAPGFIVDALTEGTMTIQAQGMTPAERVAVVEFLTEQVVADPPVTVSANLCSENPLMSDRVLWNGWGPGVQNTRFQAFAQGGLTGADIPNLELKWAFGLPGETQARAQPAIVGGRLFTGSQAGAVYALDATTGCTYWTFRPQAGVRSALSVGPIDLADGTRANAVYFVDNQANVYAVNAQTGQPIWSTGIEDHPAVRGTGSLTVFDGGLYVPMTGVSEENAASNPDYECCRFRGSITKLDASTGEIIWKTFTIPPAERRGTSSTGVPLWGPAGVGIWSAPTIDQQRGRLYAATGNAYADPPQPTADAVIALDLETGEIVWVNQLTPGDTWIGGCGPNNDNPNCPQEVGPDFDFSASPLLTTTVSGRDLLVVPQKSGMGYALDPAREGALVWEYRWGPGSGIGGVWGASVGDGNVYFAVGGYSFGRGAQTGGIHAVDLETGVRVWYAPPAEPLCAGGRGCSTTQSAAVTAIPGAVFSGSADGGMRAYAAADGAVIWTFDANRGFETNNGVEARGGSFDGPGPVVAGGMVYVLSGNGGFVGSPGNVLLAFGPEN